MTKRLTNAPQVKRWTFNLELLASLTDLILMELVCVSLPITHS